MARRRAWSLIVAALMILGSVGQASGAAAQSPRTPMNVSFPLTVAVKSRIALHVVRPLGRAEKLRSVTVSFGDGKSVVAHQLTRSGFTHTWARAGIYSVAVDVKTSSGDDRFNGVIVVRDNTPLPATAITYQSPVTSQGTLAPGYRAGGATTGTRCVVDTVQVGSPAYRCSNGTITFGGCYPLRQTAPGVTRLACAPDPFLRYINLVETTQALPVLPAGSLARPFGLVFSNGDTCSITIGPLPREVPMPYYCSGNGRTSDLFAGTGAVNRTTATYSLHTTATYVFHTGVSRTVAGPVLPILRAIYPGQPPATSSP